ncbi:MAG TPA: DMT family protein [Bacteroidales bacterium]|nr:DMT family protein [Bacteroidales bacterium]
MKGLWTILLLVCSNTFMTLAWYGHLKFKTVSRFEALGMTGIVLISWGIALFEYFFQVPANRIGFKGLGGPFTLVQLKVIQEVISLTVFAAFAIIVFRTEQLRLNHLWAFLCILGAVYFTFKK